MARGKTTDNKTIYKVMLSYATTNNFSETARTLNMPISTVEKIVKDNKDNEEFVKLWNEKREEFAEQAAKIIDKAIKRLDRQLDGEENIPTNHLTTVIGTMYDKRALARGEATSELNIKGRLSIEKLVDKVKDENKY